jgi:hypothetical protein
VRATAPDAYPPLAQARRIALLALPIADGDPQIARWIEEARAAQRQNTRRRPPILKPKEAEARQNGNNPADKSTQNRQKETEAETANVSVAQLRPFAAALLADAMAERLHRDLRLAVAPAAQLRAALTELHLKPDEALGPEAAQRLCLRLHCDRLLVANVTDAALREGATRDVTLRAEVRVPGGLGMDETVMARTQPGDDAGTPLPVAFSVGSAASTGHRLFSQRYRQTRLQLAAEAARQAAALAVHTLRTGEIAPFMQQEARVAVLPVPGPAQSDRLLFTPQGRRAQAIPAPEWVAHMALTFAPDLRPVAPQNILGPETTRRALAEMRLPPAALWREEGLPDTTRVRTLGKRLGADYVLLARITSLEVSEGLLDPLAQTTALPPPQTAWERQARAEVVGALVETRTGALLWQDRATATMSARSLRNGRPIQLKTDAEIARDAVRFALIQLQRNFHRFRADFER